MAWQAELISAELQATGSARIEFQFTNGSITINDVQFIGSPGDNYIESYAKMRLRNFDALETFVASLTPGKITIPADPVPSDADIFFAKYADMKALQKAVDQKLLAADDATLAALVAEVKSLYRDEYTKDFRWAG